MQALGSANRQRALLLVSRILSGAVALLAGVVLVSWLIGPFSLHAWIPGLATMKANTALAFLLGGIAVLLLSPMRKPWVRALAFVILAISLVTLAEYGFAWSPGIDTWLSEDPASIAAGHAPGRMASATAAGFLLLALMLWLADSQWQRNLLPAQWVALAVGLNALVATLGYVYGVESLYRVGAYSSMAVHTALCFIALVGAFLFALAPRGIMGRLIADDAGGVLLRRLLPPAVLLPVFLGAVALIGLHVGWYTSEFGTAIVAAGEIVILSLLIWWTAGTVRTADADRKRATYALLDSEARLRTVIDSSLTSVITVDTAQRIIEWNRRAESMFGWTRSEALGRELPTLIVPEAERERCRKGMVRLLETGEATMLNRIVELSAARRDGGEFPAELAVSLVESAGQRALCAFINDIGERKLAERKVQGHLGRLDLLNRITRAIGDRQDLNSIFRVVLARLEKDLPVDFACICLHETEAESVTIATVGGASLESAKQAGLTETTRVPIDLNGLGRCMRGDLVYEADIADSGFQLPQRLVRGGFHSLVLAPMLAESRVFGVLIVARRAAQAFGSGDCEFLKQLAHHVGLAGHQAQLHGALLRAYEDLRQSQQIVMQQERLRALGQMASGIAHDINNAISPISLFTELLLEREPNLSPRSRENLKTIQRSIEDVSQTIGRMREFYREREPELTLALMNLGELVQQVTDVTRARWSDQSQQRGVMIELKLELAGDLPPVRGSEAEVRDALVNLVFNAADAMPEGGVLTIATRRRPEEQGGAHACLEVSDTGVGMSAETRRRCMEPFFTTKGERGTGLGLAMVYGMAQRHGALLEVESELGAGTTVRVIFPATTSTATEPLTPRAPPGPVERMRLLVIDDDPVLLNSLRETLESDGHAITTADGGQLGIDAFVAAVQRAQPFDAVLTDLGMPYIDGRQVAAAIRRTSPDTPIVMLTGWGRRLLAENDIPPHIDRVLSKPPKLFELRSVLADLATRARAGQPADLR